MGTVSASGHAGLNSVRHGFVGRQLQRLQSASLFYGRHSLGPSIEKPKAATERNAKIKRLGENSAKVDSTLIAMAIEGATALAPHGKTLRDAASFYLSHLAHLSVSVPVSDFVGILEKSLVRSKSCC